MVQIQLQRVLAHIEGDCQWARGGSCLWWRWDIEYCFLAQPFAGLIPGMGECVIILAAQLGSLFVKLAMIFIPSSHTGQPFQNACWLDCPFTRRPSGGKHCNAWVWIKGWKETRKSILRKRGFCTHQISPDSNIFAFLPSRILPSNFLMYYDGVRCRKGGLGTGIKTLKKDVSIEETI